MSRRAAEVVVELGIVGLGLYVAYQWYTGGAVGGGPMDAGIRQSIIDAANKYGVDPNLALAVAQQESGGRQFDASGNVIKSSAGALGVFQLMPATAAGLGVNPSSTAENIDGGVRYLGSLLRQFGGNLSLALAGYNWGPGNVSKNGFSNWPAETANYVSSILAKLGLGASNG